MDPLRLEVGLILAGEQNYKPVCPLCALYRPGDPPRQATQLHEIIAPNLSDWRGHSKYHPDHFNPLAELVYDPANCFLLCPVCNRDFANSPKARAYLISLKIHNREYGLPRIQRLYRDMAALLKPGVVSAYIPQTISVGKFDYQILD